jgi:hypothetical protein
MGESGIPRIDALLSGAGAPALSPGDGDTSAVGLVQELLRGHGYTRLPDMRHDAYGHFGDLTRQAVLDYRAKAGLPASPQVDGALLTGLAARPAPNPLALRGYLTLALDLEYTAMLGLVSLTTLYESGGGFACRNLNTDRCGLSFGIIQWAQRPGRLGEIVRAFCDEAPQALAAIVDNPEGLLAHLRRPTGGVDPATGRTLDPAFDLVAEPWRTRFERMGKDRELQKVQVRAALAAFRKSLAALRLATPRLTAQRGCAFLLDLANQHGDAGARTIYRAAARPGMAEADLLAAMQRESVRRVAAQYGAASDEAASTANRRQFFRATPWLSDAAVAVA